ncbi:MAG: heme lyase CcmF/NrfE family subunit [Chloroflexi bacterium]|nr:heme lyase CcmF/NrfE family subunit [Chloroflexota bacterium]
MTLTDAGYIALLLGLALSAYGAVASVLGARARVGPLVVSGRNALYAVAILLIAASVVLVYSFVTRDFGVRYVTQYSSRAMPLYYTVSAFYGGQEGSLLYWATMLALFGAGTAFLYRRRYPALMPYFAATVMTVEAFFLMILVFFTNPLERLPATMPDGRGLNPLLQDPGMMVHPPFLLAGYMSWTIPFAFAVATLVTGRLGAEWARALRRPTLVAWTIQSVGIVLGGWWAYHVLGWGGYWGWDPVENVSLLPWLAGTAFLHSVIVVERRGKLKVWTFALIIATFALSIFGTFVVRSGVLSSVHSFAESAVGPLFLGFFGLIVAGALGLLLWRLPQIRDEEGFDAVVSRESGFLLNNLLLISIAFATFWGTIYPLATEALRGEKITVGPPFYDKVNGPLFLALLLLTGVGPLLAWRKTSGRSLWRNFRLPAAVGAVVAALLMLLLGDLLAALAYGACGFVLGTLALEYYRGTRTRRRNTGEGYPRALVGLVSRDRRRYGGYLVHLAIVVMAVGIVASNAFQVNREVNLRRDESVQVGSYTLTYLGTVTLQEPGKEVIASRLRVEREGKTVGEAVPRTQYYVNYEKQPSSRVAILSTWREDLYVFQAGVDASSATFSIFVNPLVTLVWVGGAMLILGILVAAWPEGSAARRLAWEPVPSPLGARASRPQG